MFKKIVSNLPFSPALVGQLGIYAKKLRKEKTIRQLGLIFVVLALITQLFVLFQPPESANASKDSTFPKPLQTDISSNIIKSIVATNASQGFVDASSVTAFAGDQISYTVTVQNNKAAPAQTKLQISASDLLDYAIVIDTGGGTLDNTGDILSWPDVTMGPNTEQTRTFVIRLLDAIPTNPQGNINNKSYDCRITTSFGNSIDTLVDCPPLKTIEQVMSELPKTGPTVNMIFAAILLLIIIYFYARTRQLEKEIRLIRKDVSLGTIY